MTAADPLPRMFGIDLGTAAGQALLASVAKSHGERLAAVARRTERVFGISSPHAPGLFVIGAESEVHGLPSVPRMGAAGAGLTMADALSSCLGETAERLSAIEQPGDVVRRDPLAALGQQALPQFGELCRAVLSDKSIERSAPVDWVSAAALHSGGEILVPADWCLRRAIEGPLLMPGTALSTGVAAGASDEDAAVRAMLELIERDAVALWWKGGRRGRVVGVDTAAGLAAAQMLHRARGAATGRGTWLLDITSDLGIPSIVAVSVGADGRGFACGMAARLSMEAAATAAVMELCQMELAYGVVALKRLQAGEDALNDADRVHLARAGGIDAASCALLHPIGAPRRGDAATNEMEPPFVTLQRMFAAAGVEVGLVSLTRPEFDIPVVVAIAPKLQRFPSNVVTDRLHAAVVETGGGRQWTGGVELL